MPGVAKHCQSRHSAVGTPLWQQTACLLFPPPGFTASGFQGHEVWTPSQLWQLTARCCSVMRALRCTADWVPFQFAALLEL